MMSCTNYLRFVCIISDEASEEDRKTWSREAIRKELRRWRKLGRQSVLHLLPAATAWRNLSTPHHMVLPSQRRCLEIMAWLRQAAKVRLRWSKHLRVSSAGGVWCKIAIASRRLSKERRKEQAMLERAGRYSRLACFGKAKSEHSYCKSRKIATWLILPVAYACLKD